MKSFHLKQFCSYAINSFGAKEGDVDNEKSLFLFLVYFRFFCTRSTAVASQIQRTRSKNAQKSSNMMMFFLSRMTLPSIYLH